MRRDVSVCSGTSILRPRSQIHYRQYVVGNIMLSCKGTVVSYKYLLYYITLLTSQGYTFYQLMICSIPCIPSAVETGLKSVLQKNPRFTRIRRLCCKWIIQHLLTIILSITFLRFRYNENSMIKSADCDTTTPILLFRILCLLFSKYISLIN